MRDSCNLRNIENNNKKKLIKYFYKINILWFMVYFTICLAWNFHILKLKS